MILYTNPHSRGRIARWILEEIGEPYEIKPLHYGDEMKSPDYLKINLMGKVPALSHNGKIITEAAAICAYLASVFPDKELMPEDPREKADYFRWLFFAATPIEMAITFNNLQISVPKDKERMVGFGNFETTVSTLAQALKGKTFIAGERFSAADIYVGAQIGWGLDFGTLPKKEEFVQYWNGIKTRPALKRANEKDEALAEEMGLI